MAHDCPEPSRFLDHSFQVPISIVFYLTHRIIYRVVRLDCASAHTGLRYRASHVGDSEGIRALPQINPTVCMTWDLGRDHY